MSDDARDLRHTLDVRNREIRELRQELARINAEREVLRLEHENAQLRKQVAGGLTFRVGQKRGISIYGLQVKPVTLYKSQWLRVIEHVQDLQAFIAEHDAELSQSPADKKKTPEPKLISIRKR